MGVLSKVSAVSRRQALRTLRKGLDMLRRRKHGTTGRLALPHQHRRYGEIAETVRSAPGRDPRMARFIRILSVVASESTASHGRRARTGNQRRLTWAAPAVSFGPDFGARSAQGNPRLVGILHKILNKNRFSRPLRVWRIAGENWESRGIDDGSIHLSRAGLTGGRHGQGAGGSVSDRSRRL